jgi:hypothetical protein
MKIKFLLIGSFSLLTPLVTFLLLWAKGLPDFASTGQVFVWAYAVTWVPALVAGVLLAVIVCGVIQRTPYFHNPYDFGRCFSLGAISGALTEAFTTFVYRAVTRHPFSDFWIAGAMIAGCLSGAALVPLILWYSTKKNRSLPSVSHSSYNPTRR